MLKKFFKIKSINKKLVVLGKKISEENLIKFDAKVMWLLIISALLFILSVSFKISGSSVPIWQYVLGKNSKKIDSGLISGEARGIRGDEWQVKTTDMFSQANREPKFPVENESIGSGKAPLFIDLPVYHFSSFFRPQNYGFFFLDFERGFSFYWNFKIFSLFLSCFFLLMLVTRNNFFISLSGSVWILFSSYIQWFFSVTLPEMIASAFFVFVAVSYLLFSSKKSNIIISSVVFTIFSINFVLFFYPPFQITLVYLVFFLLLGYFVKNRKYLRDNFKLKVLILSLSIIFISVFAYAFFHDTKGTMETIRNTAYPGNRMEMGGTMNMQKYFSGFLDNYFSEAKFPKILSNVCEASNFLLFFPAIAAALIIFLVKKKIFDKMLLFILGYIFIMGIWAFFGAPSFISKSTLLFMIPPSRIIMGTGVASIILTAVYLNDKNGTVKLKKYWWIVMAIFMWSFLYFINWKLDNFVSSWGLIFSSVFFSLLLFNLFNKNRIIFYVLIVSFVLISNYKINPVVAGLNSVIKEDLYKFSREIAKSDPGAKWIVFGNRMVADLIKSAGVYSVNGVKYPPNVELMKILDPNGENNSIYNRYAHIEFIPGDNNEAKFSVRQADFYTVEINPCSEKLEEMEIKYFVFAKDIINPSFDCLNPIIEEPLNGAMIYIHK